MAKKTTTSAPAQASRTTAVRATSLPTGVRRVKVRATKAGYYGEIYRRPGDVFFIEGALPAKPKSPEVADLPAVYSANWMELADADDVERTTSHNEALRQQHDEVLREKVMNKRAGDSDVLSD